MFAEAVGAFDGVVFRVGHGGGGMRARFVIPGAHIAPGGLGGAVMGGVPPSHANAALPGRRGDRPGLAALRNRVERLLHEDGQKGVITHDHACNAWPLVGHAWSLVIMHDHVLSQMTMRCPCITHSLTNI